MRNYNKTNSGDLRQIEDSIYLVNPDTNWLVSAKEEIEIIRQLLSDIINDVEHIGSTAIPNIKAKPVIDIMAGLDTLENARSCIPILENFGYSYWFDNPFPEHFFFVKGLPSKGGRGRTHHLHIVLRSSDFWEMQVKFRDYLIKNPTEVSEYENLKLELAKKHENDRDGYTNGKTEFIHSVLRKAGYEFKK